MKRLWSRMDFPWTLGLSVAAVALTAAALTGGRLEAAVAWLVATTEGMERAEIWRLWTGHLVHFTSGHFLLDVGAGAILLLFMRSRGAALILPPIVGLGVLALRPDITSYAGLSGVLHGLTVLAAVDLARTTHGLERWAAAGLLTGVIAKSLFEGLTNASVFTSTVAMGGETVYVAHLVGVLSGLVLAAIGGLAKVQAPQPAIR